MHYIKLDIRLDISKIVFGNMRILQSGHTSKTLFKLVQQCMELGITSFDHAPVYGNRACETIFGESVMVPLKGKRDQIKIISKAGIILPPDDSHVIYYDSSKKEIIQEVEISLKNLKTDYIDLLLVHRPDPFADISETAEALQTLIDSGKVISVGVSNYTPKQMDALQSYLKSPLVTNQVELSITSPEQFFNGTIDAAWQKRIPLMAWSPLGGGRLFTDPVFNKLRLVLQEIAQQHDVEIDTVAYAWLLNHPVQIAVTTGSGDISRIERAVEALSIELSHEEWYKILAASRGYNVP